MPTNRTGRGGTTGGLDIETEMHHIGLVHHVFLALEPQPPGLAGPGFAAILYVIAVGDDFGTNETALEIGMNYPGGLGRGTALAHGPGADLLWPGGEVGNQPQQ